MNDDEWVIDWVWPHHSNSDHQDYYILSRESQPKPSFATVTGRGPYPSYIPQVPAVTPILRRYDESPPFTSPEVRLLGVPFTASHKV